MTWNAADLATLTSLWNDGVDSRAIAVVVGQPRHAVLRQVIALGLPTSGRPHAGTA